MRTAQRHHYVPKLILKRFATGNVLTRARAMENKHIERRFSKGDAIRYIGVFFRGFLRIERLVWGK